MCYSTYSNDTLLTEKKRFIFTNTTMIITVVYFAPWHLPKIPPTNRRLKNLSNNNVGYSVSRLNYPRLRLDFAQIFYQNRMYLFYHSSVLLTYVIIHSPFLKIRVLERKIYEIWFCYLAILAGYIIFFLILSNTNTNVKISRVNTSLFE